ncbi:hypothetical protein RND71_001533 [Anisodus tanguticus]|uniref:Uncharacterized protein n=1 Tax=Anisodus tanguticus TaxID=243964 RepID=A0AAE1T2X2_9SOLA|nr:hypothetical protein RND71_001533 [Anisodus tanguticus]
MVTPSVPVEQAGSGANRRLDLVSPSVPSQEVAVVASDEENGILRLGQDPKNNIEVAYWAKLVEEESWSRHHIIEIIVSCD